MNRNLALLISIVLLAACVPAINAGLDAMTDHQLIRLIAAVVLCHVYYWLGQFAGFAVSFVADIAATYLKNENTRKASS